jgi:hypothetical protein
MHHGMVLDIIRAFDKKRFTHEFIPILVFVVSLSININPLFKNAEVVSKSSAISQHQLMTTERFIIYLFIFDVWKGSL